MTRLDQLTLTGLTGHGHHGVFPEERRDGQPFVVDVTVYLDLGRAGAGDVLADTIHYGELAVEIVAAIERDPVDLIETLAERIAAVVLAHASAAAVDVTVHKPQAPIPVPFDGVSVRLHRARTRAIIAVGANLGDREATIRQAVAELATRPGIRVRRASPLVETPALRTSGVDEAAPAYLNAVIELETTLAASGLLVELHRVEDAHGRTREVRWGDRTLDLDLVTFGEARIDTPDLVVPHPRAHERAFVLVPWAELDAEAVLPGHGAVTTLRDHALAAGERVEAYPAAPLVAPLTEPLPEPLT
ncbi:MAG TPA: 2-amino-4-hydroxy-6-hydroxymethyldihydropteridine diphosphokinase [Microbacteriaceae bacterium]|nr:2-amino-4-hydroxy-6-hydroxymethyldihydropteridine diphosphokinase [Microbacteriaceae bacterium]